MREAKRPSEREREHLFEHTASPPTIFPHHDEQIFLYGISTFFFFLYFFFLFPALYSCIIWRAGHYTVFLIAVASFFSFLIFMATMKIPRSVLFAVLSRPIRLIRVLISIFESCRLVAGVLGWYCGLRIGFLCFCSD